MSIVPMVDSEKDFRRGGRFSGDSSIRRKELIGEVSATRTMSRVGPNLSFSRSEMMECSSELLDPLTTDLNEVTAARPSVRSETA
jgi:hypothetical protein